MVETQELSLPLGIEQRTDRIRTIAQEIDDIALELPVSRQDDQPENSARARLQALSRHLQNFGVEFAAQIAVDTARYERTCNALAASERQFRTLAEHLPTYVARHTPHAEVIYANPSLAGLFDLEPSHLLGMTPTQLAPDGWLDDYERGLVETARTGHESQCELRFFAVDGQQVVHHVHFVAERDEAGAIASVLSIGHDITERLYIEQNLKTALEFAEGVIAAIPDIVWLKDVSGVYRLCNHGAGRLIGRPESEIIGKTDCDFFSPELADSIREKDRAAIDAGGIYVYEEWVTWPHTGELSLLEMRKLPVLDAQGNVTGVLCVGIDITTRKQIEERLARREREFRTLVEHSPDVVMRYDRDFRRVYVNPTFAALIEGGRSAAIGAKPSELPKAHHAVVYEQKLEAVFATGREEEIEVLWSGGTSAVACYMVKLVAEVGPSGTVDSVLAVGRDISELHASREKIQRMAFYDPLTGLPNRALFNERLRQMAMDTGLTSRSLTGVMMIDMDRFKNVNDTMGHAVGDEMLREAAERLLACIGASDTVARLGGDEFAVLLPDIADRGALERISKTIIDKFSERFVLNGREVFVSCSIGIALYPVDSLSADDLLKYADSAMYLAKRAGRRGFRFYSKELTSVAAANLQLESALRRAIERGEFELYYQPKVSLGTSEVTGSEALLRWELQGAGFISPERFIPVAEDTGLIVELGEWVLREACLAATEWNAAGSPAHRVAVNLSARQFQFQDLAAVVRDILAGTGCRPEWLELEITESVLLADDETVLKTLSSFRKMGISIAIDDFGTGYSSLSYLARFPIDTLKIDRSFVQKVTTDRRHAELVKAVLSIANCFGQQVVAEGVETAEQAAFLQANGCRVAQGFFYSKPLTKRGIVSLPRFLGAQVAGLYAVSRGN